ILHGAVNLGRTQIKFRARRAAGMEGVCDQPGQGNGGGHSGAGRRSSHVSTEEKKLPWRGKGAREAVEKANNGPIFAPSAPAIFTSTSRSSLLPLRSLSSLLSSPAAEPPPLCIYRHYIGGQISRMPATFFQGASFPNFRHNLPFHGSPSRDESRGRVASSYLRDAAH
ncbi:hypothetical protein ALC57_00898, partial [Trachymyrmex cornetzi]